MDILNALVAFLNFVFIPAAAYGAQLALGALGVTLIYGILRFSNFAHGDTMAFGTMVTILLTWWFQSLGITAGVLPTASAVSPGVGAGTVFASMIGFTLLYGALAVVEVGLMVHYAKAGLPAEVPPVEIKGEDDVLSFAY